jgi:hypothetical protein
MGRGRVVRLAGHRRVPRERSQTIRQGVMRTVVARERTRPLAAGEPRGSLRRLGEVARCGVVGARGGLVLITGWLWAFDGGRG